MTRGDAKTKARAYLAALYGVEAIGRAAETLRPGVFGPPDPLRVANRLRNIVLLIHS